jgi:hypothetical protein
MIKYKIKEQHVQLSWTKIKASLNDKCRSQRKSEKAKLNPIGKI